MKEEKISLLKHAPSVQVEFMRWRMKTLPDGRDRVLCIRISHFFYLFIVYFGTVMESRQKDWELKNNKSFAIISSTK